MYLAYQYNIYRTCTYILTMSRTFFSFCIWASSWSHMVSSRSFSCFMLMMWSFSYRSLNKNNTILQYIGGWGQSASQIFMQRFIIMILAKKEQLDKNILNTWKYSSPLYFHPFRPRPHCEWTNLGMVKFRCLKLFLFKQNFIWANSRRGENVWRCRWSKITCGKNNPIYSTCNSI